MDARIARLSYIVYCDRFSVIKNYNQGFIYTGSCSLYPDFITLLYQCIVVYVKKSVVAEWVITDLFCKGDQLCVEIGM